jgi:hypothetical protein
MHRFVGLSGVVALVLGSAASAQVMGPTWLKTAGDGSKVVFVSDHALVPEDQNNTRDVYLHDFATGITSLVSVTPQGTSGNDASHLPYLSADGNVVVFVSFATDLVPGSPSFRVYARDLRASTTTLLWRNNGSLPLAISPDGRFVLIDIGVGISDERLLLLDRANGSAENIDVNSAGQQMYPSYGYDQAAISADGRYVAFDSYATNVDPIDTDTYRSVYVRDRQLGVTFLASEQNGVNLPFGMGYSLAMSRDGRFLAFNNNGLSVYVRDLALSSVIEVGSSAPTSGFCPSFQVTGISDDGSRLLLTQYGFDAHFPGQPCTNLYYRPVWIDLASQPIHYTQGPIDQSNFQQRDLSADGQWLLTISTLSALSRTSIATSTPSPWFYCEGKTNSLGCIPEASFSGLASISGADHLVVGASFLRNQTSALVLWGNAMQSTPFFGGTLCVTPPLHRTPLQSSGGSIGVHDCSGTASFDFTSGYLAQHALGIGTSVFAQVYARDPGYPIPDNVQLSSAIAFVVVP